MSLYRVAIIGCGRAAPTTGVSAGQAIAYQHARGYLAADNVRLVAAADIDQGNLDAFAQRFAVPGTYTDYRQLLRDEHPDIVSICTWPGLHAEMVVHAAAAGVRGILCEKPMALSLSEADRMLAACAKAGTILSICHQRRLVNPWVTAREWLGAGQIGQLIRMEGWIENWDLLSYGTHWIDLFFFFQHDAAARWVFAQCDVTQQQHRYGHPVEDRSLALIGFDDDVSALLHIAPEVRGVGMRLIGTEGQIEIEEGAGAPRLLGGRPGPQAAPAPGFPFDAAHRAIVQDLLSAVEVGHEQQISALHGRNVTEVLMAAYASSIDRALITLPYLNPAFPLPPLQADTLKA